MKKHNLIILVLYAVIIAWVIFCLTSCSAARTNQSCGAPTLRFNGFQKMPR